MSRQIEHPTAPPSPAGETRARMRRNAGLFVLSALLAIASSPSRAVAERVLYVDAGHPSASAVGPGSPTTPYLTISEALAAHPEPGITVMVRSGVYRERVVVPASGTASSPVVIRATGDVVVDAAEDMSWPGYFTQLAGDVWVAPTSGVAVKQVFADGTRMFKSAQTDPALVEPGAFGWFPGVGLAVNVGGGNPATHSLAVSVRRHGFLINGRSHVIIDGFTVRHAEDKGIEVLNGTDVTLRNNTIVGSFAGGIALEDCSGVLVQGNRVSDSNHHGIEFRAGVTNSVIERNESFGNAHMGEAWATGIYLASSSGNTIRSNRTHHNQDSGIEIQSGSNDNLVLQNASWSNGDHGFALLYATGSRLLNNTAWGNSTEGFSIEGNSTSTLVRNSISVNLSIEPGSYCLFVDTSSLPGLDADHDVYWNIADQPPVRLGTAVYKTVAAMQAATGMGLNSFGADPRFVSAATGDFHLRTDSPAIDAAATDVPGWAETDAEQRWRVDAPGTPNTGTGSVSFADRGAYEFQGTVLAVAPGGGLRAVTVNAAYPNPSRRGVTFSLELPVASHAELSVFDVQGREVWSEARLRPAGRSEVAWGLSNRAGARVPNGVYLARVDLGGASSTVSFVVME